MAECLEVTLGSTASLKENKAAHRVDPYAVLCFGGVKCRTDLEFPQGARPVWNHRFNFLLPKERCDYPEVLDVDICDSSSGEDVFLGCCRVELSRVYHRRALDIVQPVHGAGGKLVGHLRFHFAVLVESKHRKSALAANAAPAAKPLPRLLSLPPLAAAPSAAGTKGLDHQRAEDPLALSLSPAGAPRRASDSPAPRAARQKEQEPAPALDLLRTLDRKLAVTEDHQPRASPGTSCSGQSSTCSDVAASEVLEAIELAVNCRVVGSGPLLSLSSSSCEAATVGALETSERPAARLGAPALLAPNSWEEVLGPKVNQPEPERDLPSVVSQEVVMSGPSGSPRIAIPRKARPPPLDIPSVPSPREEFMAALASLERCVKAPMPLIPSPAPTPPAVAPRTAPRAPSRPAYVSSAKHLSVVMGLGSQLGTTGGDNSVHARGPCSTRNAAALPVSEGVIRGSAVHKLLVPGPAVKPSTSLASTKGPEQLLQALSRKEWDSSKLSKLTSAFLCASEKQLAQGGADDNLSFSPQQEFIEDLQQALLGKKCSQGPACVPQLEAASPAGAMFDFNPSTVTASAGLSPSPLHPAGSLSGTKAASASASAHGSLPPTQRETSGRKRGPEGRTLQTLLSSALGEAALWSSNKRQHVV